MMVIEGSETDHVCRYVLPTHCYIYHSKNEIVILVDYNNNNTLYSCLSMSKWMACVSMFSSFSTNTDHKHSY